MATIGVPDDARWVVLACDVRGQVTIEWDDGQGTDAAAALLMAETAGKTLGARVMSEARAGAEYRLKQPLPASVAESPVVAEAGDIAHVDEDARRLTALRAAEAAAEGGGPPGDRP